MESLAVAHTDLTVDKRVPLSPTGLQETGLDLTSMLRLAAKQAADQDMVTAGYLSSRMKLPKILVNYLIKELVKLSFFEARGLEGEDAKSDIRYSLSTKGLEYARAAIRQSTYSGPAPVSLDAFCAQVIAQSIHEEKIDKGRLIESLKGLVLSQHLVDSLGPAVSSGRSMLLYGPPGNGKTSIAERISGLFRQTVWIPRAIEVGGQIINFFDEAVHVPVTDSRVSPETKVDQRWVECKRPVIKTGGELTLGMLDLIYNEVSNIYEAPIHLKATGGVFIIDDFGRQQVPPQSLINRWIVPLERGYDFLTLHTGKKFRVPFDELVVFSTNIEPRELTDEAGLRRLHYKIFVNKPTKEEYFKIFNDYAASRNIHVNDIILDRFFDTMYQGANTASCYHPKYLLDYVDSFCRYYSIDKIVTQEMLQKAWSGMFVTHYTNVQ